MADCGINFFVVIHRFSLVKAAMNATRICKLHNGVNKSECAMNIHRSRMGGGRIFLKTFRTSLSN
jgi:hypothetical protein